MTTKDNAEEPEKLPVSFPHHVAIIMDGNGRWASKRGLPRTEGHRRGVQSVRDCVAAAIELGISYLTLYTFSSENWRRPFSEISDLMGLLKAFIKRDLAEGHADIGVGLWRGIDLGGCGKRTRRHLGHFEFRFVRDLVHNIPSAPAIARMARDSATSPLGRNDGAEEITPV